MLNCRKKNVEVVCPKEPGTPEGLWSKLEAAVELLNTADINTLIVYFSGHGFLGTKEIELGGPREYLSFDALKDILTKFNKNLMVFLDCCYAKSIDIQGKKQEQELRYFQFNACCSYEEVPIDPAGELSIFTSFVIQALTKVATGSKCLNENCPQEECKIDGEFINPDDLVKYVESHIENYKHADITPFRTHKNVNRKNNHLAYNYNFLVEIEFGIYKTFSEETIKLGDEHASPLEVSHMDDLKKKLFRSYFRLIGRYNKGTRHFKFS